ncbi:MAG: LD-carboxypeptidase [Alphaproteobacteria bacterium]|nr:LD-carboxypeptidase [Rickettsiales bacterium]
MFQQFTILRINNSWSPLKKGDIIDIIGVSSTVDDIDLQECCKVIESTTGLIARAKYCKIQSNNRLGYINTVGSIVNNLIDAIEDKESKALWCIRGGSGANRIWRCLKDAKVNPVIVKPIIGFSDVTCLHAMLRKKLGWPVIHGVMASLNREINIKSINVNNKESLMSVANILLDNKICDVEYSDLEPINIAATNFANSIHGKMYGGNLSTISAGLGTSYGLNSSLASGKFFICEEVNSNAHQVDRYFHQLYNMGIMQKFSAVIIGDFTSFKTVSKSVDRDILHLLSSWGDLLDSLGVPVFRMPDFGHGDFNRPVPLFTSAKITSVDSKKILSIKTGASWKNGFCPCRHLSKFF